MLGSNSNEHYYSFTLTETSSVTVDGCDADFDIYLRIYNADLTQQLAERDDGGCDAGVSSTRSRIIGYVLPAGTYNIIVEGYDSNQGSYTVGLTCALPTTTSGANPSTTTSGTGTAQSIEAVLFLLVYF